MFGENFKGKPIKLAKLVKLWQDEIDYDGGTCAFICTDSSGQVVNKRMDTACHAGLVSMERPCDYVVTSIYYDKKQQEEVVTYLDWLLNRSVWSRVFLSKDPEKAVEDGCVVASAEVPWDLFIQAMVATRHPKERPAQMFTFHDLVVKGVDEGVAFVLSSMITCESREDNARVGSRCFQHGHRTMNVEMLSERKLGLFCKSKYVTRKKSFKEINGCRAFTHLWTDKDSSTWLSDLLDKRFKELARKTKVNASTNPFLAAKQTRTTTDSRMTTYKEAIRRLITIGRELSECVA